MARKPGTTHIHALSFQHLVTASAYKEKCQCTPKTLTSIHFDSKLILSSLLLLVWQRALKRTRGSLSAWNSDWKTFKGMSPQALPI